MMIESTKRPDIRTTFFQPLYLFPDDPAASHLPFICSPDPLIQPAISSLIHFFSVLRNYDVLQFVPKFILVKVAVMGEIAAQILFFQHHETCFPQYLLIPIQRFHIWKSHECIEFYPFFICHVSCLDPVGKGDHTCRFQHPVSFPDQLLFISYIAPGILPPHSIESVAMKRHVKGIPRPENDKIRKPISFCPRRGLIHHLRCRIKSCHPATVFHCQMPRRSSKGTAHVQNIGIPVQSSFLCQDLCFPSSAYMYLFSHQHLPEFTHRSFIYLIDICDCKVQSFRVHDLS